MKKNTAKKPAVKPKKATATKQEKPAQPGDTPKVKGLPPEGSLNNYGIVQMPPHAPSTPVFRLPAERRPQLTAVELAALTGALHLPATREGAATALRCVWECALVLKEQAEGLKKHDDWNAKCDEIEKTRLNVKGFDPYAEEYPMPHKRFLALINRAHPRDGITIGGKKMSGKDLFRAFAQTDPQVAGDLGKIESEGWSNAGYADSITLRFIYWRDKHAKGNKVRTKRNLKKGDARKKPRNS